MWDEGLRLRKKGVRAPQHRESNIEAQVITYMYIYIYMFTYILCI